MKRQRHWTIHAVGGLVLLTVGAMVWFHVRSRKISRFEDTIAEAGGAVHYKEHFSRSYQVRGAIYYLSDRKPVAVEISSGSHPIPPSLGNLRSMRSVKKLSLNTSAVGDYLVPTLSSFRHIRILDLTGTEISSGAVIQILEALSGLDEFRLSKGAFSEKELEELQAHRLSHRVVFVNPGAGTKCLPEDLFAGRFFGKETFLVSLDPDAGFDLGGP